MQLIVAFLSTVVEKGSIKSAAESPKTADTWRQPQAGALYFSTDYPQTYRPGHKKLLFFL